MISAVSSVVVSVAIFMVPRALSLYVVDGYGVVVSDPTPYLSFLARVLVAGPCLLLCSLSLLCHSFHI